MPNYDFKCTNKKCKKEVEKFCAMDERNDQVCDDCGAPLEKIIGIARIEVWKADWWDLDGPNDSVFITSKKQLNRECEKRGKYSTAYG